MQDVVLDELDLRLLNALQIDARASWTRLGSVLGVDPVTLARRWERLRTERLAWVTALPLTRSVGTVAIVDIEAKPGTVLELADTLGRDREAISIDITSGTRDIVVIAGAASNGELFSYLLERLGTLDSLARMQTNLVSRILSDASRWRLRALEPREVKALNENSVRLDPSRPASPIDGLVAAELQRDGRASTTDIADRLGLRPRRVSQAIGALLASGRLTLRTEVVRSLSGWPVAAWYFIAAPAVRSDQIANQLNRIDQIRTVVSLIGRYNIAINVWLRSLDEVARLEASIEQQLPDVRITDRSVVMRTTKLAGNLLDENGRVSGYVAPSREPD